MIARMRVIAIEEHFSTPMFREKVGANEFRNFYLTARSQQLGHDIGREMADLGEARLRHMWTGCWPPLMRRAVTPHASGAAERRSP